MATKQKKSRYVSVKTKEDYEKLTKTFKDVNYLALKTKMTDRVSKMLLAGAMNRELFYDVVIWAKSRGFASKPTFSRRKTFLQKLDIIHEESVPTKFGRPRIRLILNKGRYEEIYSFGKKNT